MPKSGLKCHALGVQYNILEESLLEDVLANIYLPHSWVDPFPMTRLSPMSWFGLSEGETDPRINGRDQDHFGQAISGSMECKSRAARSSSFFEGNLITSLLYKIYLTEPPFISLGTFTQEIATRSLMNLLHKSSTLLQSSTWKSQGRYKLTHT